MKLIVLLITFTCPVILQAQSTHFKWANTNKYTLETDITATAITSRGSYSYTTGFYNGELILDNYTTRHKGLSDIFIAKSDSLGNFIGLIQLEGKDSNAFGYPEAIIVDGQGNIIIAGTFNGTIDFDPGNGKKYLTNRYKTFDAFISKYTPDGKLIWVKSIGAGANDGANSVAVDNDGYLYITGSFEGTVSFDEMESNKELTSNGLEDVFVLKMSPDGDIIWSQNYGDMLYSRPGSIAIDHKNNIVVAGKFSGEVDFDSGPGSTLLRGSSGDNLFILKLDTSGKFIWATNYNSSGIDAHGLAVDNNNDLLLAGEFSGQINFNNASIESNGLGKAFIIKLTEDGGFKWARSLPFDGGYDVQTNARKEAIIVGYSLEADTSVKTKYITDRPYLPTKIVMTKLDSSGILIETLMISGSGDAKATAVCTDTYENVYITGVFRGAIDFDPGPGTLFIDHTSTSGLMVNSMYILKFSDN